MLRPSVPFSLAIFVSVSPRRTVYSTKAGSGVGVGRTKDGVGVGPAGVGRTVGVAAATPPFDGFRLAGSGTHAARHAARMTRARMPNVCEPGAHVDHSDASMHVAVTGRYVVAEFAESTGVGAWSENSAARARPSAAVAIRSRPPRLATKQARSAARRTSLAV